MSLTINNPGGGDCGFYAFSIGLVDIIQFIDENELMESDESFASRLQEAELRRTSRLINII